MLSDKNAGEHQDDEDDDEVDVSLAEKISKRKKSIQSRSDIYRNCNFILGSFAEIERICSIVGNILKENRASMSPIVFESLLFLKANSKYWTQVVLR